jgi:hypothetical protein
MNTDPNIIDISCDSTSESSGWANNYLPPKVSTSGKKKVESPVTSEDLLTPPPYVFDSDVDYDDDDDDSSRLAKVLGLELEKAASSMRPIPVPVTNQSSQTRPKPPKQVLGLPCQRL